MPLPFRFPLLVLAVACLAIQPAAARQDAPSLAGFNRAVAAAYAPARIAMGYLRTGNVMPAGIELERSVSAWRERVAPFADRPPELFADLPEFAGALGALGRQLEETLTAADAGEAEAAYEAVSDFRTGLSDLRAAAGLYLFPDCVLDLSRAMDALYRYRHAPPDFQARAAVAEVGTRTGILGDTIRRCDRLAAPEKRADEKYRRLVGGLIESLEPLAAAIRDADSVRFINVLREQRSLERLIAMELG
jgi:hypothetical protein